VKRPENIKTNEFLAMLYTSPMSTFSSFDLSKVSLYTSVDFDKNTKSVARCDIEQTCVQRVRERYKKYNYIHEIEYGLSSAAETEHAEEVCTVIPIKAMRLRIKYIPSCLFNSRIETV